MAKVDRRIKGRRKKITPAQKKKLSKAMEGNKNAVGNEGGRPTDYDPKKAKHIYKLLLMMMPIDKICEIHQISRQTFYRWKDEIPEFRDLVYQGEYGVDQDMVVTLKKKAKGFSRRVEKPIKVKDEKTGADTIVNHKYIEYHPPDTRAIEIYLRNRTNTKNGWSGMPDEATPPPPPTVNVNQIDLSKLSDAAIKEIFRAIKSPDVKG